MRKCTNLDSGGEHSKKTAPCQAEKQRDAIPVRCFPPARVTTLQNSNLTPSSGTARSPTLRPIVRHSRVFAGPIRTIDTRHTVGVILTLKTSFLSNAKLTFVITFVRTVYVRLVGQEGAQSLTGLLLALSLAHGRNALMCVNRNLLIIFIHGRTCVPPGRKQKPAFNRAQNVRRASFTTQLHDGTGKPGTAQLFLTKLPPGRRPTPTLKSTPIL